MQLGPNILPFGEIKEMGSISAAEFAQTIANYLGGYFTANHPVNEYAEILIEKNRIALTQK